MSAAEQTAAAAAELVASEDGELAVCPETGALYGAVDLWLVELTIEEMEGVPHG